MHIKDRQKEKNKIVGLCNDAERFVHSIDKNLKELIDGCTQEGNNLRYADRDGRTSWSNHFECAE